MEPVLDVVNGVTGLFLQLAEPFFLLAIGVVEVAIGELAPLLLGFALELVPITARLELGLIVDFILIEVYGEEEMKVNEGCTRT